MKLHRTPIALAVLLAASGVQAQQPQQLDTVVVSGIRASLQKSLTQKKNAATHVEVITAEDIGKMPDKNVADSLQRVPGLNISSASGAEGGFDENDKVSMRGTSPNLTQTLVDGHGVASGEWFILNQTGEAGRSVSYTLLPADIVGQIIVRKSAEASLVEGGTTGSIDIRTRNPLDFDRGVGFSANLGLVRADLAKKNDPQVAGLLSFVNEDKSFGLYAQFFSEKRSLRRDGIEILGYEKIVAADAKGNPNPFVAAFPEMAGKWAPTLIGAAFFEQTRKREGGLVKAQFRPSRDLSLMATVFSSELEANNYNRNYMLWGTRLMNGWAPGWNNGGEYFQKPIAPVSKPTVRDGVIVAAEFPDQTATPAGVYDMISRPKSGSKTNFVDLEANWNVSDALTVNLKGGTTKGSGYTATQDVMELDVFGAAKFQLNGVGGAPSFSTGRTPDPSTPGAYSNDWIWGANNIDVKDKESYAQIDAGYALDGGAFKELKFGARATSHDRSLDNFISQGPQGAWADGWKLGSVQRYPGDYSYAGNVMAGLWYYTPAQLAEYGAKYANRDPVARAEWNNTYQLNEKTQAAYLQGNFGLGQLSGNVGLRFVRTEQTVNGYQILGGDSAATPTKTSAFGNFLAYQKERSYTDLLPSLNLRYALSSEMVLRGALTRTMTRPDFSAIAGSVSLDSSKVNGPNDRGTGQAPNFDIDPVRSTNFDVALEYYFAPRSMVSGSVFYMDMGSLITGGTSSAQFMTEKKNPQTGAINRFMATYDLQTWVNDSGTVKGFELAWEQPVLGNFGLNANFTHTDAERKGGKPMTGASKRTYNLGAYYEDDSWNARVSYTYRSDYLSGNDWGGNAMMTKAAGVVNASLGYKVSKNLTLQLDGRNLNDPELVYYYAAGKEQPRAFYKNGAQYYLSARIKL